MNATRTPLVVANWKMYKTATETADFFHTLATVMLPRDKEIVICPAFTALPAAQSCIHELPVKLGGQNMHWKTEGAYTGEVSARMLAALGCSYVIIGHSERRELFGETNEAVVKKVSTALAEQLTPIVCVRSVEEVSLALRGKDIVIAYEPVWAIGTGNAATPEHAQDIHSQIRTLVGENIRIIYGGSVNEVNAGGFMRQPDVDGLLVGGASLDVEVFRQIVNC